MTPDERAIRGIIARWREASAAGDTSTVLSLMTDSIEAYRLGIKYIFEVH